MFGSVFNRNYDELARYNADSDKTKYKEEYKQEMAKQQREYYNDLARNCDISKMIHPSLYWVVE